MGFSNGNLTLNATRGEKGDKGNRGEGFSLTADSHFHIKKQKTNRRLTAY